MTTGFLTTQHFLDRFGERLAATAADLGLHLDLIILPDDETARLPADVLERIDISFFSGDLFGRNTRGYFAAAQGAPNLKWMQTFNAGVDNPVFNRIRQRGVRMSTASGSTAVPIAQTAITGLLMLARRMPHYIDAQRRRTWERLDDRFLPNDLSTETLVVYGLGAIGSEIARLGQALGLHVIGVRRSPLRDGDPVDELVPPSRFLDVLPRAQWVAFACPLTDETRGVLSAEAIARMPQGSYIVNIARGEVVDEPAMIAALQSGKLAGAYLDVFYNEPLEDESPLWDLPNVIITPHNSSISTGNEARTAEYFFHNLAAWARNEPMINEVL